VVPLAARASSAQVPAEERLGEARGLGLDGSAIDPPGRHCADRKLPGQPQTDSGEDVMADRSRQDCQLGCGIVAARNWALLRTGAGAIAKTARTRGSP